MKTGIIFSGIAIAFTCLAFVSCDWFTRNKATQKVSQLVGEWSLVNIKDSSKNAKNTTGLIALGMAKDSIPLRVEFKPDNSFTILNDTGKYYIDSVAQTLFIKEDTTIMSLMIKEQTDSTLQLFSITDSVWYKFERSK